MKDTIIKGNGKSRIIKAPEDMPETYIEWRNQAIQGRTFFDIGLNTEWENENSGCDMIGTPLNKTTLLSDKTVSSLQLEGEDPTVNDALYKLSSMRAQPNGIATLNSSGKLVQMPTAADVGAAPINIRQFDITPFVPDNGGDLMCRCWINPWHEAHLMIRWSLRSPLTGTIEFAKLPDECLPIMAFDTTCVLRSPSSGIEAGIVNIGWGGQISICRSTTSVNDTFTMLCANINYHTYY